MTFAIGLLAIRWHPPGRQATLGLPRSLPPETPSAGRSQPAIARVREALSEIKKVAKKDPIVAAEGAVLFLEKVSPALAHVDGSSGAIGSAVNHTPSRELSALDRRSAGRRANTRSVARAPLRGARGRRHPVHREARATTGASFSATTEISFSLGQIACSVSHGRPLSPDPAMRGHFHGTTMCLSSLFQAGRYDELREVLERERFWPYKRWAVRALAAAGKTSDAIALAEASRGTVDGRGGRRPTLCEGDLALVGVRRRRVHEVRGGGESRGHVPRDISCGRQEVSAAIARGRAGPARALDAGRGRKWFAAAKDAGLFDEALALARRTPTDPRTLARAARDHAQQEPAFAIEAGLVALDWLAQGYGYEVTSADVWAAYLPAKEAAERREEGATLRARAREIAGRYLKGENLVAKTLGRELVDA